LLFRKPSLGTSAIAPNQPTPIPVQREVVSRRSLAVLLHTGARQPASDEHLAMALDRATLFEHLAQAERQVARGEAHLARQEALVAALESDGHVVFLHYVPTRYIFD
jgi:hypothetical protein